MNQQTAFAGQLLVVMRAEAAHSTLLERAVLVAKKLNYGITLVSSFYKRLERAQGPDDLNQFVHDYEQELHREVEELEGKTHWQGCSVSWKVPLEQAVAHLMEAQQFDMLMKQPDPENSIQKALYEAHERFFEHDSDIPFWLVKEREWDQSFEALCCLDIGDDDPENIATNHAILATGTHMAERFGGEMHIADCYYGEIGSMRIDYDPQSGFHQEATLEEQHREKMAIYLSDLEVPEQQCHFVEGIPDHAIPEVAGKLNAELAIIGNNTDKGTLDKLFGDTAHQLVKGLPCDILIVKSKGV